ncbi:MAG: hypothetical protein ABI665_02295 [Vicinamibacterales bacterium]
MRSRIFFGVLLLTAIGALVARTAAESSLKWAIVNLTEPTLIAGKLVSGPVVFVHDDDKMVRGEACTSVHRFSPVTGVAEEIVAFHCKPRLGDDAPAKFTATISREAPGPSTLTEYQFAGDTEAHGVPAREQATAPHDMNNMKGMQGMACCAGDMKAEMKPEMKSAMKCGDGCKDCKDCKGCKK